MRLLHCRHSALIWCAVFALAIPLPAPHLRAQTPSENPQQGQGRGYGRGGGMGMGMFGGAAPTAGTITAISGNNITIRDEQGETFTVQTGPNTRIRKDRELAKISDIKVGDTIMAAGNLDDQSKTIGAVFVVVLSPAQAAQMERMRASFGKTWTAGRVTVIKDLTLTIERPDKTTQTVAVDENTVFHRRERGSQQDITFPEINVGDIVRADGSVQQNGNFLATTLNVAEPRQPGQGRFRNGIGNPGGNPPQPNPPQN